MKNTVGKMYDNNTQIARKVFNQARDFTGIPPAEVAVFKTLTAGDIADIEQKFGPELTKQYIAEMQKLSGG